MTSHHGIQLGTDVHKGKRSVQSTAAQHATRENQGMTLHQNAEISKEVPLGMSRGEIRN